jgi:hypothetical protein
MLEPAQPALPEQRQTINAVYQDIIAQHPELAGDGTLPDRLERAHAHAVVLARVKSRLRRD